MENEIIMEVVNEALVKPKATNFFPEPLLGVDACGCTGNKTCQ